MVIDTVETLDRVVWEAAHHAPAIDVRAALPPAGVPSLRGFDALMDDPRLIALYERAAAETRPASRAAPPEAATLAALSSPARAEALWRALFIERSPVSEPTRAALTSLGLLGGNPAARDPAEHRALLDGRTDAERVDMALRAANVSLVISSMGLFHGLPDDAAPPAPRADAPPAKKSRVAPNAPPAKRVPAKTAAPKAAAAAKTDPRFRVALSVRPLLYAWKETSKNLKRLGYAARARMDDDAVKEVHRFLDDRAALFKPVCLACTWPPGFDPDGKDDGEKAFRRILLPWCRERGMPLFVTLGNESVMTGAAELRRFSEVCRTAPDVRFLASGADARALFAAARMRSNLLPAGFPYVLEGPLLTGENAALGLDFLGSGAAVGPSGARTLEQLPGRWAHIRWQTATAMQAAYRDLFRTGWRPSEDEIVRDAERFFAGNLRRFLHP